MRKLLIVFLLLIFIPMIFSYYKGLYRVYNYCQQKHVRLDADNEELCGLFWAPLNE